MALFLLCVGSPLHLCSLQVWDLNVLDVYWRKMSLQSILMEGICCSWIWGKKSSKDRNFLVLLKVKYVNMGTSLEILVRLMTKPGKKKKSNAAQINVLKKSRSVFVLWSGDSRKDLCKWAVVVVGCFLLYIYM